MDHAGWIKIPPSGGTRVLKQQHRLDDNFRSLDGVVSSPPRGAGGVAGISYTLSLALVSCDPATCLLTRPPSPHSKCHRHSPLVTLSTCSRGQGPLDETREGGRGACVGAPVAALKARLVTAKALDDFISAGGVESRSLSAGINPQQGQCTGTGRGRLYL